MDLDLLAWRYLNLPDGALWVAAYAGLFLGGLVAAIRPRGQARTGRASYFARIGLILIGLSLTSLLGLLSPEALVGGWLWLLVAVDVAAYLVAGFLMVRAGQARSRDAWGHARLGILTLVPFAWFWLLFTPGRNPDPGHSGGRIGAVLLGIAGLVATRVMPVAVAEQATLRAEAAQSRPAVSDATIALMIRANGLPTYLNEVAEGLGVLPQNLGDGVTLERVRVEGNTLRFHYLLADPEAELGYGMREQIVAGVCGNGALRPAVLAGATLVYVYTAVDRPIGELTVTPGDCAV